jgi:hypothetical protein
MCEIIDAGGAKGYSYPGMNVIAENCEMTRMNVWLRIQDLQEKGLLHMDKKVGTSAETDVFGRS